MSLIFKVTNYNLDSSYFPLYSCQFWFHVFADSFIRDIHSKVPVFLINWHLYHYVALYLLFLSHFLVIIVLYLFFSHPFNKVYCFSILLKVCFCMANYIEYLLMCLFAVYMSSSVKYLFMHFFFLFSNWVFCYLSFESYFCDLDTSLSDVWFAYNFFHYVTCNCILFARYFWSF